MSFGSIRWLVPAAPLLVVAVLEYCRWALGPRIDTWTGRLIMDAVVVLGAVSFYVGVSGFTSQLLQRLEKQNRELRALRAASLDITAELSLDAVLEKIVEQARGLLDCRYGALSVYDLGGKLETFVTSGIDSATRDRIGAPPVGRGLLRLPLKEGQTLRLEDLTTHPSSVGFPAEHPAMRSLLAVPVLCREPFRGNLYLSGKSDGSPFSEHDEETLARFAAQAAVAVDNARLHAKAASLAVMDERLRLAREMHDGQAQVLAYVNTKAQVVDQLMVTGDIDKAREHLEQMAAAAREVYADVREGILSLRTAVDHDHDLARVLKEYGKKWQDQCGIPLDLQIEGQARYSREAELHLLRVVQEALTNARKHSRANKVELRASLEPGRLVAEVEDDGVGFSESDRRSGALGRFGLSTMRERCEAIGASLDIRSEPDRGTRIRLEYTPRTSPASRPTQTASERTEVPL